MPYSTLGCQTCKIRRIKCDKTRPTCQRCIKSRRVCLQKVELFNAFEFHIENRYASGETHRPRGPRATSLTILRPDFDLETRALTYYLRCHVQPLTDTPSLAFSLCDAVATWQVSGWTSSLVDLALSSIALAVFGKIHKHVPAGTEATSRYFRLLRIAQKRIPEVANPITAGQEIDACLLATLLMSRYEAVRYRLGEYDWKGSAKSLQCWSHHDGAMAILKIWHDSSQVPPTIIIKQARRECIKSSLLRHLPLPDWILDGGRFGEHDLELDYDRIAIRTVNLHHACASVQRNDDLDPAKIEELDNEARALDEALQEWAARFPRIWGYQRHLLNDRGPRPRKHRYSSTVYSFSGPGYAAVWCQYFAARLVINNTHLRLLGLSRQNPTVDSVYDLQILECVAQMRAMADGLSSTIPFCLETFKVTNDPSSAAGQTTIALNTNEEIKPYLVPSVIWPLVIASSVEGLDGGQRLWFKSELARLGGILGEGILEAVETAGWATL